MHLCLGRMDMVEWNKDLAIFKRRVYVNRHGYYYQRIYGSWKRTPTEGNVCIVCDLTNGYHWYILELATCLPLPIFTKYVLILKCQLQIVYFLKICRSEYRQIWSYPTKSGWRSRYGAVWELSPLSLSWLWCSGANKPSRCMCTMYSPPLTLLGVIGASPKSNRI